MHAMPAAPRDRDADRDDSRDDSRPELSHRDRAVLRAVAAGRCTISAQLGGALVIDGLCFSDQFAGPRLTEAGLIATAREHGRARLTPTGRALLTAA